MKNIITILSDLGITVPEDKHADLNKAVSENYKTIAEHGKVADKLTAMTKRAETAEDALKGFDGIDPTKVKEQLEDANRKIQEAQEAATKQIEERDFADALKGELDSIKFTSAAARKAVEAEIKSAGLKLKNGKILGLSDLIDQIRKDDASAFAPTDGSEPAKFTAPKGGNGNGGSLTKKDIMSIKDPVERQAKIVQNMHLFGKE